MLGVGAMAGPRSSYKTHTHTHTHMDSQTHRPSKHNMYTGTYPLSSIGVCLHGQHLLGMHAAIRAGSSTHWPHAGAPHGACLYRSQTHDLCGSLHAYVFTEQMHSLGVSD